MSSFIDKIRRGFIFAKENPQLLYTIFLLIVIPTAFLISGENFLQAALKNQERLEKDRIGTMQDVFVAFTKDRLNDPTFLYKRIQSIIEQNNEVESFRVVSYENGQTKIIASLNQAEIGKEDIEDDRYFRSAALNFNSSLIFKENQNGTRHWRAIRAIMNDSNEPVGFIMTDISMAYIDTVIGKNIRQAYYFLIFILILIFYLLIRHARIIDYTVLYKKIKEIDTMKDDFIGMAAHELRTPLTVIRGYADLLKNIPALTDIDRENLRRIDVSTKDLDFLISDILDVVRIEQGRMSFSAKPIELRNFLPDVIDSFNQLASDKGLTLRQDISDGPLVINADETRLRQILVNIVGNSVKYTPHGEVVIKVSTTSDLVVIRVSDTGIGISAEDQKNLFQKFYRVKSDETKNIRGTGLGLWITNQIILGMGGTLSVESIKGKGTDFVVSFPRPINETIKNE